MISLSQISSYTRDNKASSHSPHNNSDDDLMLTKIVQLVLFQFLRHILSPLDILRIYWQCPFVPYPNNK